MKANMIFLMLFGVIAASAVGASDNMQNSDTTFWDNYMHAQDVASQVEARQIQDAIDLYDATHQDLDFWDRYVGEHNAARQIKIANDNAIKAIEGQIESQETYTDFWDHYLKQHRDYQLAREQYYQSVLMAAQES